MSTTLPTKIKISHKETFTRLAPIVHRIPTYILLVLGFITVPKFKLSQTLKYDRYMLVQISEVAKGLHEPLYVDLPLCSILVPILENPLLDSFQHRAFGGEKTCFSHTP